VATGWRTDTEADTGELRDLPGPYLTLRTDFRMLRAGIKEVANFDRRCGSACRSLLNWSPRRKSALPAAARVEKSSRVRVSWL